MAVNWEQRDTCLLLQILEKNFNKISMSQTCQDILPIITYAFHINIYEIFLLHKILFIVGEVSLDY